MKSQRLLRILGLLEDDLLAEAEDSAPARRAGKRTEVRWLSAAACLLLVAGIALWYHGAAPPVPPVPGYESDGPSSGQSGSQGGKGELPLLTVDTDWGGGMGFEGYMAKDISDLVNANPWKEGAEITTLPVYRNVNAYDKAGAVDQPNLAAMEQTLLEVARSLGMDTERLEVTTDYPSGELLKRMTEKYAAVGEEVPPEAFNIGRLYIEDQNFKLEASADLTITIHYKIPVTLPKGYDFNHYTSYEETNKVADYLRSEYSGLLNMKKPITNLSGGDYNIYSQQDYSIRFYEGAGTLEQQILHYNFNQVTFACDDEGKLFLARVYQPDLSEKMGDYPIITAEQARALLAEGHYITTVPEDFPGTEYIRKTELVYRHRADLYALLPHLCRDARNAAQKRPENLRRLLCARCSTAVSDQHAPVGRQL